MIYVEIYFAIGMIVGVLLQIFFKSKPKNNDTVDSLILSAIEFIGGYPVISLFLWPIPVVLAIIEAINAIGEAVSKLIIESIFNKED